MIHQCSATLAIILPAVVAMITCENLKMPAEEDTYTLCEDLGMRIQQKIFQFKSIHNKFSFLKMCPF